MSFLLYYYVYIRAAEEVIRLYLQIRYLRELKGLSLLDVSERSGVTVAQLSRVERGLSKPRPSTLRKIAQALNVSVEELWTPDEGKLAA